MAEGHDMDAGGGGGGGGGRGRGRGGGGGGSAGECHVAESAACIEHEARQGAASNPAPFVNHDLTASRSEYIMKPPWPFDAWVLSQLRDSRDAPMGYLMFNICTIALPAAIAMFVFPVTHWMGAVYLLLNSALFMQRFILCLHFVEHLQ
ncbi:hypothetical protein CBR_g76857, partial [Chara braunii]